MNTSQPPPDDFDPTLDIDPETASKMEIWLRKKIADEQARERAARNVHLVKVGVLSAAGMGVMVGTYKLVVAGFDGLGRVLFGKSDESQR